jgi:hypothetical protein
MARRLLARLIDPPDVFVRFRPDFTRHRDQFPGLGIELDGRRLDRFVGGAGDDVVKSPLRTKLRIGAGVRILSGAPAVNPDAVEWEPSATWRDQ